MTRTMTDHLIFPAIFLLAIFVGFRIGRWWAVALVLLVPLAFPLYGPDSDGAPRWFYPTLLLGPPVIVALSVGVIGRKLRDRQHAQQHRPAQ